MSDWSIYELEDIVWDQFGGSDDRIVPHPADGQGDGYVAQVDCQKKPRHEAVTAVRKSAGGKFADKDVIPRKEETSFPTLKDRKAPMLENGSLCCTPDGVFSDLCGTNCIKEVTSLASDDTKTSSTCFKISSIDSVGNGFCEDDTILGNRDATIDRNLCRFPLVHLSTTESDLDFFGSEHQDRESNDLLYYGWPDIGNFDDVDRMFRSCDSTFGQGNANNDELSWFSSSSHDFNGSEDALKSGFKSSCSESSALKSISKHCEADIEYMPDSLSPSIMGSDKKNTPSTCTTNPQTLDADKSVSLDQSPYGNWLDTDIEDRRESLSKEQAHRISGGIKVKISPVTHIANENSGMTNLQRKQLKHQTQLGEKIKDRSSEYLGGGSFHGHGIMHHFAKIPSSVPSATQVFPSPAISQQKQNLEPDSFGYMHTYTPDVHCEYNHPSHQISGTPTTSSMKSENNGHPSNNLKASSYASNHAMPKGRSSDPSTEYPAMTLEDKIEKICWQQQQARSSVKPQYEHLMSGVAFTDQVPDQKQLHRIQDEIGGHSEVGVSIEHPAEVDSSTVLESSCMSSMLSGEGSLEATSFQQLQNVMEQLDIRTKLCIRDSLYRLARNAERRHTFADLNTSSRCKSGLMTTEESNKCPEFMDIETDTNPIDRSIAHLLFHSPLDPSTRPANDSLSLESRTIIHRSTTSQPAMSKKLICEEETDVSDTNLVITDQ